MPFLKALSCLICAKVGEKTEDNNLEPIWSGGPILSSALVDVIEKTIKEVEEDEHQEESEIEYNDCCSDDE